MSECNGCRKYVACTLPHNVGIFSVCMATSVADIVPAEYIYMYFIDDAREFGWTFYMFIINTDSC